MNVTTISKFRKESKKYFDQVIDDQDVLLITRSDGQTIVAMPLEQYNAEKETGYLMSSDANRSHLQKSVAQSDQGQLVRKTIDELKQYE